MIGCRHVGGVKTVAHSTSGSLISSPQSACLLHSSPPIKTPFLFLETFSHFFFFFHLLLLSFRFTLAHDGCMVSKRTMQWMKLFVVCSMKVKFREGISLILTFFIKKKSGMYLDVKIKARLYGPKLNDHHMMLDKMLQLLIHGSCCCYSAQKY